MYNSCTKIGKQKTKTKKQQMPSGESGLPFLLYNTNENLILKCHKYMTHVHLIINITILMKTDTQIVF